MSSTSDAAPSWFGGPANTNPARSSLEPTWGHSAAYKGSYDSKGEYAKDVKESRPETDVEMAQRFWDLGDQRTEHQTRLMNRLMELRAASARTDALDRQWRGDVGEANKTAEAVRKAHAACAEAASSRQEERAADLNRWHADDRAAEAARAEASHAREDVR